MDDQTNLLRLLAAQVQTLLLLTLARDRFGKGLADLTDEEMTDAQAGVDAAVRLYAAKLTPQIVAEMMKLPPLPQIH
jgi:hypothetical protein